MPSFLKESRYFVPAEDLYRYHTSPGAFSRLTPPWESVALQGPDGAITTGQERTLKIGPKSMPITWVARHEDFVEGRQFVDTQVKGPFRHWRHTHHFRPEEKGGSSLIDEIEYKLPLGLPVAGVFQR
jgi:ligand-binding SRPBCC domain-containing protein